MKKETPAPAPRRHYRIKEEALAPGHRRYTFGDLWRPHIDNPKRLDTFFGYQSTLHMSERMI
jgi:hypothetical protein